MIKIKTIDFKSGFVSIIGRPNVGKSTLINQLMCQKISIVSKKPQTTRNSIKAILSYPDCQIVLIDTPGIHKPNNKLDKYMIDEAVNTFNDVDVVLFVIEATEKGVGRGDFRILERLKSVKTPIFLIVNKVDLTNEAQVERVMKSYGELATFYKIIPISASQNIGTKKIIDEIKEIIPEGPQYFPDDMVTDKPERFIVCEVIREKILRLIDKEIPHGVGIEIESFKKRDNKNIIDVGVNIYCEKESHKGILIGKNGNMLKKIGTLARKELEYTLGEKIFLEIWVKVKQEWRDSERMLKILGYK